MLVERDQFSPITYAYRAELLASVQSEYQLVEVYQSPDFGRILVIDGVVQLTERDEYIYHEMLAHVPLHIPPDPQRVLIIGGGDGGLLREVAKHPGVQAVTLVEIDPEVVRTSKDWFPIVSTGFDHPKANVLFRDGKEYLETASGQYDVILVDSTDPIGAAVKLFESGFYQLVASRLSYPGVFACQSESIHFHLDTVREVQKGLRTAFSHVDLITACIPTYPGNLWTFSIASNQLELRGDPISAKVSGRYYAEDVHRTAFLPLSLVEKLGLGA